MAKFDIAELVWSGLLYYYVTIPIVYNRGRWYQKQVTQAGISNYTPQNTVGCNYLSSPTISASCTKGLNYHGY